MLQHTLDFPAAFVLFPLGFFPLLLALQPAQLCLTRGLTLLICFVHGTVQMAHVLPYRRVIAFCTNHYDPGLTCMRVAGHPLVALFIGAILLVKGGLALFSYARFSYAREVDGLRRLWWCSRFAHAAIGVNVVWPVLVTWFSQLDVPDSVSVGLFGLRTLPEPWQKDAAFVVTGLVWIACSAAVSPSRRSYLRAAAGFPSTSEGKEALLL